MIKRFILAIAFILSFSLIYADNTNNLGSLDLYLNGTLGNVGTINNSASYTDPLNAFDENPSSFAYITSSTQNTSYQYLGKTFPSVFMESIYLDLRFDKSGSGATLCDYKLEVLNDSGWNVIQSGTNVQCLNNDIVQNVSLGYSIYGFQVGMRNTVGSGDSRTLRIDDIIPYKTNINGYENYYNSSEYTLNFSNSFNSNSNIGVFLDSNNQLPTFNDGDFNGYVVNDGTCVNMGSECNRTSSVNSSFGNAISFDGVDDYINISAIPLGIFTGAYTISSWIKFDSLGGTLLQFSSENYVRFRVQSGFLEFQVYNSGWKRFTLSYNDIDEWVNIAVKTDGSSYINTYLNGVLVTEGSYYSPSSASETSTIGNTDFHGSIDDVKVWDYVLSDSEILAQMSKTNPLNQSRAFYNFDESNGTKVLDGNMFVQGNTTTDVWNRALSFNGSQGINFGDTSQGVINYSVSFDMYINSLNPTEDYSSIFTILNSIYLSYNEANNKLRYQPKNDEGFPSAYSNSTFDLNKWYNIILILNNTNFKIYVDGVLDGENEFSSSTYKTSNDLLIGYSPYGSGRYLNGHLDNIYFYNKSLTSLEISQYFNGTFYNTSNLVFSSNAEQLNNTKVFDRKTQLCYNCSSVSKTFYSPVEEGLYTLWSFDTFSSMRTLSTLYFDYTNPSLTDNLGIEYNNTRTINLTQYISFSDDLSGINSCIVQFSTGQSDNCSEQSFTINEAGNITYDIIVTDNAFNQEFSSGTIYFNPIQYISFMNENNISITNFTFDGLNYTNQVEFKLYDKPQGNNVFIFEKLGFETTNVNINLNSSSLINQTFVLNGSKIVINIYDRESRVLITDNVTIQLVSSFGVLTSTITGQKNISSVNFINEEYILILDSANYLAESFFFEFNNREVATIDAYMLLANDSNLGTHTIKVETEGGDVIESATVNLLEWDASTSAYITTSQLKTNANGEAQFNIELSQKLYKFLIVKDNFQQQTQPNLITTTGQTTLVTLLATSPATIIKLNGVLGSLTNVSVNASHERAFFTVSDTSGFNNEFCLNIYSVLGNQRTLITQNCTTSSNAVLVSQAFNVNKSTNTLIEGTALNNNILFVLDTILIKGNANLQKILQDEFGFLRLVPLLLIICAVGLGIITGNLYIGTILIIIMSWVSTYFASNYFSGRIAGVITIIALAIMWGAYKRK